MTLLAHGWTIVPHLAALARPRPPPDGIHWRGQATDGIGLSGVLHLGRGQAAKHLVVVIHGMGGDAHRPYVLRLASAALEAGASVLRLNLRGADLESSEFYHAGMTHDLHGVLDSPALRGFEAFHFIGFSLGGHLVARLAAEPGDPRLGRMVALCPPLDLGACQRFLDRPSRRLYRANLLVGMRAAYVAAAARGPVPTPWHRVREAKTLYQWDQLTAVPRYGFGTPERYYAETGAGPRLKDVVRPLLIVYVEDDPIVPVSTVEPWLAAASPHVVARRLRSGGHGYFPRTTHLGLGEAAGVDRQMMTWLLGEDAGEHARDHHVPTPLQGRQRR